MPASWRRYGLVEPRAGRPSPPWQLQGIHIVMDKAKLESLRARYAIGNVFDATDPVLRRAAAAVETPGGQRRAPYSGIPTFLDLPAADSAAGLDVAAIGVPMDLGVSNRPG